MGNSIKICSVVLLVNYSAELIFIETLLNKSLLNGVSINIGIDIVKVYLKSIFLPLTLVNYQFNAVVYSFTSGLHSVPTFTPAVCAKPDVESTKNAG